MKKISFTVIFTLVFCFSIFAQTQNSVNCPKIIVTGPLSVVPPGEAMTFTANIKDFDLTKIEYKWTVTGTNILSGQQTSVINVDTRDILDKPITATVEIQGLPQGCNNSASETGIIAPPHPLPTMFDEFGKLSKKMKSCDYLRSFQS